MTNSSAWAGASESGQYSVYLGIWTNWSRGRILGATLTLSRENGTLLIAFTALFVGLVSSCFWRILCLIFHQFASTQEPRDALHHQKQAVLRNSASAMSGLWAFSHLTWTWRQEINFLRTLPFMICAAISVCAFTLAGGLSSQLSSGIGNEVLVNGHNCGFLMDVNEAGSQDSIGRLYPNSVRETKNAMNYAQQCYSRESSMLDCTTFVRDHLPGTVDTEAPCPFQDGMCREDNSNLRLDTGYIDSSNDLGINTPPSQRVKYRMVLHCAPLVTEGFTSNFSTEQSNYTRYHYGSYWDGSNHTYQIKSLDEQYNSQIDNNQYALGSNLILAHFFSEVVQGNTYPQLSDFRPIPELFRSDGDLQIMFLGGNGVHYIEPNNDSWYRGSVLSERVISTPGLNGSHTMYRPEEAASPMACVMQFQLCNDKGECGPLASMNDAAAGAAPLFNTSSYDLFEGGEMPTDVRGSQYYWFLLIMSNAASAFSVMINGLAASSLASEENLLIGIMGPLPNNQWQLDVTQWWATMLASLQAGFVAVASGPTDPSLQQYKVPPYNSHMQDMCDNQKIRSNDYTSFSLFGLCFTYIVGALVILISFALEPLLAFLQHRRNYKEYKFLEWTSNGTLQLQRLAYQGIGSGTWDNYTDTVPKTKSLEVLKVLPLSYPTTNDSTLYDEEKSGADQSPTEALSINSSEITESGQFLQSPDAIEFILPDSIFSSSGNSGHYSSHNSPQPINQHEAKISQPSDSNQLRAPTPSSVVPSRPSSVRSMRGNFI